MYQINSLTVTQIRIFKVDELSYQAFQMPSGSAAIRVAFNFQQVTPVSPPIVPDPQGALLFTNGEFSDGVLKAGIPQLQIEPRRITLIINATSETANKAFEALKGLLMGIDPRVDKPSYEPIFMTEETTSTVKLDFSVDRFFESKPLNELTRGIKDLTTGFGSQFSLTPSGIKFQVTYGELREDLKAQAVIQLPKEIRIELRNQTRPEDMLYFVQSPNPSDKHLELLNHIESTFGNK